MAVNKELVEKVLDHLRQHPEEWDQDQWFCETTACFGGRALLMSGYRIIDTSIEKARNADELDHVNDVEMVDPSGNILSDYANQATEVLGLPAHLADEIFGDLSCDFDQFESVVRDVVKHAERLEAGSASSQ